MKKLNFSHTTTTKQGMQASSAKEQTGYVQLSNVIISHANSQKETYTKVKETTHT